MHNCYYTSIFFKDPIVSLYNSARSSLEASISDDDDDGVGADQRVLVVLTDSSGALSDSLGPLCPTAHTGTYIPLPSPA